MTSLLVKTIASNLKDKSRSPAVWFDDKQLTGAEFWSMIVTSVSLLRRSEEHRRMAISLPTSPEALALFLAGLIVANDTGYFDPCWAPSVTQRVKRAFGAQLLIDENWPQLDQISPPELKCGSNLSDLVDEQATTALSNFTCFTSGSTGLPKGCRRSQQSWINSFQADNGFTQIKPDEWVVIPGNFAHSLFLYAAIRGLYAGAGIVLFPKFNPKKISTFIERVDASILFAVPAQLDMIAKSFRSECKNLKRVLSTGSKLPSRVFLSLRGTFPKASIIEFYGTTELSYVAAREMSQNDPSSLVGKPLPGVEVTICDQASQKTSTGKFGTVYVKSNMAFDGYVTEKGFQPAEASFTVGDTGYLSDLGDLHLQGRIDRVFQSSGRKIIPENIEIVLLNLDAIRMVAVLAMPDDIRENRIAAVIQPIRDIGRNELVRHLRKSLASYETPHHFYLCQEWPKTAGGKSDLLAIDRLLSRGELEKLD